MSKQEEQERRLQAARSQRRTPTAQAPTAPAEARKLDPNSAAARRLAQRSGASPGGSGLFVSPPTPSGAAPPQPQQQGSGDSLLFDAPTDGLGALSIDGE